MTPDRWMSWADSAFLRVGVEGAHGEGIARWVRGQGLGPLRAGSPRPGPYPGFRLLGLGLGLIGGLGLGLGLIRGLERMGFT